MRGKKSVLTTVLAALLLALLLAPAAHLMEKNLPDEGKKDAEHLVEPMQRLLEDSPQKKADVPVEPIMDIEDAWNVEDTRTESWDPLIEGMRRGESELGYDRESRTFYCTVGMSGGESWPQIELHAQGAPDAGSVRIAWIDDYTYDYRSDAVAMGYRYELLAYTDTAYEYVGVVFTGLPIVTLEVEAGTEIGESYVPSRVGVSSADHAAVNHGALVHQRGGGYYKPIEKDAYRIEFHAQSSGKDKKRALSVLGMEADTDWLLLSNAQDETAVRNYLAFDLWSRWNPDGALMTLDNRLVEVFVGDEYKGLYQLMQRVSPEREIARMGGDPDTACLVRVVAEKNESDRPIIDLTERTNYRVEYVCGHQGDAEKTFADLEHYLLLSQKEECRIDDETFTQLALTHLDTDELISFFLFLQSGGLVHDNVYNNLYIWMFYEDGRYVYRLAPWDMDRALYVSGFQENGAIRQHFDMSLITATRVLDLDLNRSREKLWNLWEEKRATLISDEALHAWIIGTEEMVNASGAYLRESQKWYGEAKELNLSEILYFETEHMKTIEWNILHHWPVEQTGDGE